MRTVLTHAFIYTGDAARTCIPDGAVVVDGTRIAWLGPTDDAPLNPGDAVQDIGGQVIIPGLINTHAHGGLTIHRGCCDDGDLFEWAAALAPYTSTMTIDDNRWSCFLAVIEMVRAGITTACDCARYGAGVFSEVAATVGMRSLSGALANSPSLRRAGRPNWPSALEETLAAQSERASGGLCRFYLGAHSPYNCTPELLVAVKQAARERNLPFVIHVAENRREVDIILERYGRRPVEHLYHLGVLDEHSILAHCVWLEPHEISILAETGARVAHNPVSNGKLASGIAPVRALRERGVPVGLGTDSTLSNNSLNLFQEMKTAVLLQRLATLDGFALSALDAFQMATLEGAQVLGWDAEIGSLQPGKQADLVVVDIQHPLGLTPQRVLSDLVYSTSPHQVRSVMVAGQFILADGQLTLVDETEVLDRIRPRDVPL
jgi:5-methylthioadenosine/S-adenosylhomocysteine deaminase